MLRYVLQRLLMTIFVIIAAAILIFTVMYFVPGDPAKIILGPEATAADLADVRHQLGIDRPFLVQLGSFMYNTFIKFDMGTSWFRNTSVFGGMLERIPRTFLLGFLSIVLTSLVGIPMGVNAATHHRKWQDKGVISFAMVFMSVPEFWVALLFIIFFSLRLNILPSFGIGSWKNYVLPILSGALAGIGGIARYTRSCVLEVVHADYITTARAKGVMERKVIYQHMLPNALIPVLTNVGTSFTRCIGGTIVMEKIFSFPGVGLYLSDAIASRDYPVIRGCVIVIAAFTAILMLLVDLSYGYVDPRIKAQYVKQSTKKGKIKNVA
ncbi:MAG: ABC transporter permease [Lachnospiraceae bacterium]|jgi:peptide/nickel transport system permease protein|nr:ABC transporter permease [Lachnospiraceae bacterium]